MNCRFSKGIMLFLVVILFAGSVYASTDLLGNPLPVLEKPVKLTLRQEADGNAVIPRFTQPQSIMNQINNTDDNWEAPLIEMDFRINEDAWLFDRQPGFRIDSLETFYEIEYEELFRTRYPNLGAGSIILYPGQTIHDEANSFDSWLLPEWFFVDSQDWNFDTNTLQVRYRFVYEYEHAENDVYGIGEVVSPWSEIASIGKDAVIELPEVLDAPQSLYGEIRTKEDQKPYFYFTYVIPQNVLEANQKVAVINYMDWKIGNGSWASESNQPLFQQGGSILASSTEIDPVERGTWEEVNIDKESYMFRMRFEYLRPDGTRYQSAFSNTVSIGMEAWSSASTWATDALLKAKDAGLLPDCLMGQDLTVSITRAEFAAVAVKVYEALSGLKATPVTDNPFRDTTDLEVLKAYNVGITDGVGEGKFEPNTLLNREQAATMMTRVYKKVLYSEWTLKTDSLFTLSFVRPAAFLDDINISSWAKDSVYFMSAKGIITGFNASTQGRFDFRPRNVTPADDAIHFANATREQVLIIANRMIEKLK